MISNCTDVHGNVLFAYPTRYLDILRILHASCETKSFVHCTKNGGGLQSWFFWDSIKPFWQKQFYYFTQNKVNLSHNIFGHFQLYHDYFSIFSPYRVIDSLCILILLKWISHSSDMTQREKSLLAKVMRKECLLRQQKIGFFLKCIFTTTATTVTFMYTYVRFFYL